MSGAGAAAVSHVPLDADFLFGFGALFAIINPYGLAFVFLDRTMGLSERDRANIALRVAIRLPGAAGVAVCRQ